MANKGLIKSHCLQSTFKSNNSVTTVDIEWYRVPGLHQKWESSFPISPWKCRKNGDKNRYRVIAIPEWEKTGLTNRFPTLTSNSLKT